MELFARVDMELRLFKKLRKGGLTFCVYLHLKVKSGPSGDMYSGKMEHIGL